MWAGSHWSWSVQMGRCKIIWTTQHLLLLHNTWEVIHHHLNLLLPQWWFKVRNLAAVRNCHHNVFYSCFISLQVHFRNPSWVLVKMIMILWPLSKYLFKIINKNSLIIMNDSSYITSICDIWHLFFSFFLHLEDLYLQQTNFALKFTNNINWFPVMLINCLCSFNINHQWTTTAVILFVNKKGFVFTPPWMSSNVNHLHNQVKCKMYMLDSKDIQKYIWNSFSKFVISIS